MAFQSSAANKLANYLHLRTASPFKCLTIKRQSKQGLHIQQCNTHCNSGISAWNLISIKERANHCIVQYSDRNTVPVSCYRDQLLIKWELKNILMFVNYTKQGVICYVSVSSMFWHEMIRCILYSISSSSSTAGKQQECSMLGQLR